MMGMIEKEKWYPIQEKSRTYVWRDGVKLTIDGVVGLLVSKSGRHYLKTTTGSQYIIAQGWLYLSFEADDFSIPTGK